MKVQNILALVALVTVQTLAVSLPANRDRFSGSIDKLDHSHSTVSKYATKKNKPPHYTFRELYNMTVNFFDNFAYPNNVAQAHMINSTLFSEDVLGRVDVTRNFVGRELNTEYAFGLFANIALNPNAFTLLGIPVAYNIIHFAANDYIVSVALIVDFKISALGVTNPVEVDFWCTFNEQGEIDQYDATFRYLQWQFDALLEIGTKLLGLNDTNVARSFTRAKLADSICETAQSSCNGTNTQYESKEACVKYLGDTIPFGEAHQMGFSTLLCRMVHQNMVPLRPDTHCSHVGPSGGGYCTDDRTYAATVREPFFTTHPFVPKGYHNKNATLAAQ